MAHSDGVPATIFETEPYIEIHTGLQTDNSLCFEKRGITPNLSFSTPDSFVACGMVKAGLGVALVNRVIADELSDAVAYVPLDPPEVIDTHIAVARYRNNGGNRNVSRPVRLH